jgi:hypothetical protein
MNQIDVCKYLARELGEVIKDDETGFHARFGNCYCVILADRWTTRKVRGRRVTAGKSALVFLQDMHRKNGIDLSALEAAIIVSNTTKAMLVINTIAAERECEHG